MLYSREEAAKPVPVHPRSILAWPISRPVQQPVWVDAKLLMKSIKQPDWGIGLAALPSQIGPAREAKPGRKSGLIETTVLAHCNQSSSDT